MAGRTAIPDDDSSCRLHVIYAVGETLPAPEARFVQIVRTCLGLAEAGYRVDLIAGRRSRRDSPERVLRSYGLSHHAGLSIHLLPMIRNFPGKGVRLTWTGPYFRRCTRLIRRLAGPDSVVYVRHVKLARHLIQRLAGQSIPVLYEAHEPFALTTRRKGSDARDRLRRTEGYVLRHASGVVLLSRTLGEALAQLYGRFAPHVIIPHGAPPPAPPRTPGSFQEIVYVGQLYPWKRVDLLLAALPSIPKARARIIGGKREDLDRLAGMARRLGVSDRVVWEGQLPPADVEGAAAGASVAVITGDGSETPGSWSPPLKLFEYIAMGIPVVACATPAICEILKDGETGILVEPGNPIALSQGLRAAIEEPRWAAGLADRARKLAEGLGWEARGEKIASFARKALNRRPTIWKIGPWRATAEPPDVESARAILSALDSADGGISSIAVKWSEGRTVDVVEFDRGGRRQSLYLKRDDLRSRRSWKKVVRQIWARSRARTSWDAARYLTHVGIRTPRPVFVAERWSGPFLREAVFAAEPDLSVSHAKAAAAPAASTDKRFLASSLGRAVGELHRAGISHGDCKPTNFIVHADGEILVTDLENAAVRERLSPRRKRRDLDRLLRGFDGLWDRAAVATFLNAYALSAGLSKEERIALSRFGPVDA